MSFSLCPSLSLLPLKLPRLLGDGSDTSDPSAAGQLSQIPVATSSRQGPVNVNRTYTVYQELQRSFMRMKWFQNQKSEESCTRCVVFMLRMWIRIWLSWKADWNMNPISQLLFHDFSSEVWTLKLRFSVGSYSLALWWSRAQTVLQEIRDS